MIITHIIGGLGNQMFQYAFGRALALRHEQPLRVDIDTFRYVKQHQGFLLDKLFNVQIQPVSRRELAEVLGLAWYFLPQKYIGRAGFPKGPNFYFQDIELKPNLELQRICQPAYLKGWWQSQNFFASYSEQIAEDFRFALALDDRNKLIAEEMRSCHSLSIHIRRGDYVSTPEALACYAVCDVGYYTRAIDLIAARCSIDKVYVFSDDLEWARRHVLVPFPCEYIAHNSAINSHLDLQLMTYCRSHIIANSSFSWWGAWLSNAWGHGDGLVVAPKRWGLKRPMPVDVPLQSWILT